jgi:hypothetical protein
MVPKFPLKPGTKASEKKEASLRRRYPPLDGITASMPCIIVDMQGIILTWYLPGILTDSRLVNLFALPITAENLTTLECNVGGTRKAPSVAQYNAKRQQLAQ